MAMEELQPERLLEGETLRELEREYRDLSLSLRALGALLRQEGGEEHEEHVLGRILEAEINQMTVLVGDLYAALRLEQQGALPKDVDLSHALVQAARRSHVRVGVECHEQVTVTADPASLSQVVQSLLSLGVRMADGLVVAGTRAVEGGGEIVVRVPGDGQPPAPKRYEARLSLLRRMVRVQGGRLTTHRRGDSLEMRVWYPSASPRAVRRTG